MQIENEVKLDFKDVLIRPKRSKAPSRSNVYIERSFDFLNGARWTGVPIMASNMSATGVFGMAEKLSKHNMITCLHKHYSVDQLVNWFGYNGGEPNCWHYTYYTMGITDDDFDKLTQVLKGVPRSTLPYICVDVANGYTEYFQKRVKRVRELVPNATIMAGNVATPEMVSELILSGAADIVKVGIGPGSVCTTRVKTGVGYPQLSAIIECADAAHGNGGLICADGGCTVPGDVAKAFGAGADFVMLGGMFAGVDECEGQWKYERVNGYTHMDGAVSDAFTTKTGFKFYGMSSEEAQDKYTGGTKSYNTSEGKSSWIKPKGPVDDVVKDILGGLRSACAYVGAMQLKHLSKCCTFVRVMQQENRIFNE
jgi:GMP reductase